MTNRPTRNHTYSIVCGVFIVAMLGLMVVPMLVVVFRSWFPSAVTKTVTDMKKATCDGGLNR